MDENVVFPSMGSTDSLQQESVPKAKSGSGQQLGQRSPLKDILNTSPSQPRVMKTAGMPSRFESVRQLDEEAEWRERTEVVTALDHHHNKGMARDLLEQALLGAVNRSQTRTDAGPVAFREVKNVSVMDSESEYESAEENEEEMIQSPQEKTTMVSPNSPTSPLIWGNSSMLHAASAISTPNRSESFENSLLNSFEKMKIVEKDDDKFHDASDDVIIHQGNSCKELGPANIPTSPSKESVQPITSPCKESVQPITSPCKESVQPITSPCKESVQPTTSPCKESVQPITSPSKESVQPITSPSKESVQPITSPSKESVQSACSQGKECTQAVCSPCKEDVQHNIPCVKDNSMPDKESKDFIPSKIEGLGPSSETVALSKCEIDTSLSCQVENMECSSDSIDLPHPTVTLPVGGAVESCTDHTELNRGAESFTLPVSQEELKCNSLPDQEKELHTFSSIIDTQVRDADTLQNTPKEQSETSQEMSCPQEEACAPASPHTKCSPSKKGYTDILDVLDDIDFNPFATKASVMNSPDRVDLPQTMNVDEREVQESVSQASRAKDEISDHQLSPAGSHNDNVKERVHSSIVQCDVDVDSTITMWTEEDAEKPRSYLSSPCESSDSKHLIKDKEPGQEQQAHKKQKPVAEKALTHPGKDCLPVSCKAYNLEYLEDPSYDPFTTKSCVVNTPERQGGISTTSNESTMSPESDEKTCKQLSRRMDEKVSESVKVNVSPEESVPQCPLKLEEADDSDEQVSLENTVVACPPELSEDSRETDSPSYKHFDLVGIVGDPNLDPFKTKASVANSPDRRTLHQSTGQESGQSTRKLNFGPQWQSQDVGQQLDHVSNIVSKEESKEKAKAHSGEPLPVPTPQDKLRDISAVSPSNRKGNRKSLAPEEEFFNASDFFSNPEVMDALETHGVQGNKCNLVRNSLYMKFDPLVSGRQSLAPYLAQQLLRIDQEDVRRSSGLISFSPSPKKKQKGEHHQEQEVPVESFFSTMDNIVTLDTTATTTLDSTALEATNETVIHNLTAAAMGKMVSEAEMNNRIKNVELMMQDEILRKSRIFEEEKKELTKKIEEQNIALLANEEEINSRKGTIQQMTNLVSRMKAAYDAAEKQHQENLEQQKAELEAKLSISSEDHNQTQEELKKTEASFFQLVRKFERLREVCESLHQQKEKLVEELERVMQEKSQSAEKYKAALKTLQESHEKAQEEHMQAKQNHEQDMKRASVLIKHAELKILSLTETEAKKNTEIQRLTSLLEDITGNMGGAVQ